MQLGPCRGHNQSKALASVATVTTDRLIAAWPSVHPITKPSWYAILSCARLSESIAQLRTECCCCRREAERAKRLAKAQALQEAEWLQAQQSDEGSDVLSEEEWVQDEFYCAVCDKVFKSDRALANHERCQEHAA